MSQFFLFFDTVLVKLRRNVIGCS